MSCAKCNGTGKIEAFSHIANGTCFWCKGSGNVKCSANRRKPQLSPLLIRKCEWVMNATADDYEKLPIEKLDNIREFAHAPDCPEYPEVFSRWIANGEDVFLRKAQDVRWL